ncbi:translocation/assembly module TamB domain-containing protein [Marinivivus vitaminiproducens]|uniref:translocation/assembly module TamB domain-containing protein n=1 Tax=Marinivivus vitaminiproducens TaxID=3035935 RepID=UPI00279BF411|nr:translocation/assembly module TamB domain-containing protein [Geminicoccaceae bacterium SCSIO 64248]
MLVRTLRWSLWILLGLVGLVVLAIAGVIGGLQVQAVRDYATATIEDVLSGPDSRVEISGFTGTPPFDMRIARFAQSDADGPWLEVDNARLAWRPLDLLSLRLTVEAVEAERVAVNRLPPAGPEPEPAPEPSGPIRLPELPSSLPQVALERLHVDRIELGQPVLGQAAVFTLDGRLGAVDEGRAVEMVLNLDRQDAQVARVALDGRVDLAARTMRLALAADETSHLLAGLAGVPEASGAVRLEGDGPLADWRGTLLVDAPGIARSTGEIGLDVEGDLGLSLDLSAEPAPGILPAEYGPLVGDRADVMLRVAQTGDQAFDIPEIALAVAAARLSGNGRVDLDAQTMGADLDLAVADLAPLEAVAGTPLGGAVNLKVQAQGPIAAPDVTLNAAAERLDLPGAAIDRTALDLALQLQADDEGALSGARVQTTGQATGVRIDGAPDLPGDRVDLALDADVPFQGMAVIDRLDVRGLGASLTGGGRLDPARLQGEGRFDLAVPDIAPFARLGGLESTGNASVNIAFRDSAEGDGLDATLRAAGLDLAALPPPLDRLIGERVILTSDLTATPEGAFSLRDTRLDAAAVKAQAQGRATAGLADLDGSLSLQLMDLAALSDVAGTPLAGHVNVDTRVTGSAEIPNVTLDVLGQDLRYGASDLGRLTVTANGDDVVRAPHGRLEVASEQPAGRIDLVSNYALQGQQLTIDGLSLRAPQTVLDGRFVADLQNLGADGQLTGRAADLSALSSWAGQRLAGTADLDVRMARTESGQEVHALVNAANLSGPIDALRRLALRADVTDALGEPGIDADLQVTGLQQAANRLDRLGLQAKGTLAGLKLTASAAGEAMQRFDIRTAAEVAQADARTTVVLSELGGTVGPEQLRLTQPTRVELENGTTRLSDLDLRYGAARLAGNATYGPQALDLRMALSDLNLASLEPFGVPPLEGNARLDLTGSGTPAAPRIDVAARVARARYVLPSLGDVPPADIALDAALTGQRASGDLRVTGVTQNPITANAALPVRFAIEPFRFDLPQDGSLQGAVNANVGLDEIQRMLALDGHRLEGRLVADLALAGTPASPGANGSVTIRDGLYENGEYGTNLRDLRLTIQGQGNTIRMTELSATDGGEGRINGSGQVNIATGSGYPFQANIDLGQAQLVRRTEYSGTLSGTVGARGSADGTDVTGRLRVDRAEVNLVDPNSAPSIPTVEVSEPGERDLEPGAGPDGGQAAPYPVNLDVAVDMPGRIFVRGRGLESEWQGNLTARGSAYQPEVVGQIEIRRGELELLTKRFELPEGRLTFSGDWPPIPTVLLEARSQQSDFAAIVRVTGPATEPDIEITSEPVVPQDEVISRLLFNKESRELTPTQALQLAAAISTLQGGGGMDVLGTLRQGVGLDTLTVGEDSSGAPTLQAGRYVTDRVYVGVERGMADESGKATVEVEITPRWSLEGEASENAAGGVGLKWQYDY